MTAGGGVDRGGFYQRRVFPRLVDIAMDTRENRRIRADVCEPLRGEVLEIGFGSGHNLPFLPSPVTRVLAVDPMQEGRRLARRRLAESDVAVDFVGIDGQSIDLPDGSVDAAPRPGRCARSPMRSPPCGRSRASCGRAAACTSSSTGCRPIRRSNGGSTGSTPLQNRIACGCNIQRDIPALIEAGGMAIEELDRFYIEGHPKVLGWTFQGIASVVDHA